MNALQLTIDEKFRVRFPPSVIKDLRWAKEFSEGVHPVLVAIGSEMQMKILEKGKMDRIRELLKQSADHPKELKEQRMSKLRALASMVELKPSIEKTRITLTIPREIRNVNRAFDAGSQVMIFVFNDTFEIWDLTRWTASAAPGVQELEDLTADEIEALE